MSTYVKIKWAQSELKPESLWALPEITGQQVGLASWAFASVLPTIALAELMQQDIYREEASIKGRGQHLNQRRVSSDWLPKEKQVRVRLRTRRLSIRCLSAETGHCRQQYSTVQHSVHYSATAMK
jgi:hypothetical protein